MERLDDPATCSSCPARRRRAPAGNGAARAWTAVLRAGLPALGLGAAVLLPAAVAAARAEGPAEGMRRVDRVRIAEMYRLGDRLGDRLWAGWSEAPFALLLVTPEREYLVRHPSPSADFRSLGRDELLGGEVHVRDRTLSPDLLATFPAVPGSPVPVIVVGQAERTGAAASGPWLLVLLHEHFHQLQMSRTDYHAAVEGLGLAGEDRSGMWMLDYPFPYGEEPVAEAFDRLREAAAAALEARGTGKFPARVADYRAARGRFEELLDPADRRYFSFQIWQEGIARYTQMRIARWAAGEYQPSRAFRELDDFDRFAAEEDVARLVEELRSVSLEGARRTAFYPLGAAEGLLLDDWAPGWRERYFGEKFAMGRYFDRAAAP